jgi:hypothetical protein
MVYGAYRTGRVLPAPGRKISAPLAHWMLYDFFLHVTMLHGFHLPLILLAAIMSSGLSRVKNTFT